MFGIGLGEIIIILLAIFLIAPKEIPGVLKKIGIFFRELDKLKREIFSMKGEMEDIINEARKTVKDAADTAGDGLTEDTGTTTDDDHPPIKIGDVEMVYKKREKKAGRKKPPEQNTEEKKNE